MKTNSPYATLTPRLVFASVELASTIERAEAQLSAEITQCVADRRPNARVLIEPVSSGVAVYSGPGSPVNKMIGAGFGDAAANEQLDRIESLFAERGAALQAEVSTLAEPGFHALLCRRGYVLQGFENVLGLRLVGVPPASTPAEYSIEVIRDEEIPAWATMLVDGFERPDVQGVTSDQLPPREIIEQIMFDMSAAPSLRRYVVRIGGVMAAGASMRVDGAIAQLTGSATRADFRRRGLQSALIRVRLADARAMGCTVAVVTTAPGSKSQENMQTQGFSLLYSRAILVKP